ATSRWDEALPGYRFAILGFHRMTSIFGYHPTVLSSRRHMSETSIGRVILRLSPGKLLSKFTAVQANPYKPLEILVNSKPLRVNHRRDPIFCYKSSVPRRP